MQIANFHCVFGGDLTAAGIVDSMVSSQHD